VPTDVDQVMTQKELADMLKVSVEQLRLWRVRGFGPPMFRVGLQAIRYRRSEVERWITEQEQSAASA
jgi:predicted DNA-binding transcriptional regulator AlpA